MGRIMGNLGRYKDLDLLLEDVNKGLLNEASFMQYRALVRVRFSDDKELHMGSEKGCELLRAIPGGTRVKPVQMDRKNMVFIFDVRIISQKSAKDAFIAFKKNCLERYHGVVLSVEVGAGSIEEKAFIK